MSLRGVIIAMVVITGVSGLVGGNLARALLAQGRKVRRLIHRDQRALQGLGEILEWAGHLVAAWTVFCCVDNCQSGTAGGRSPRLVPGKLPRLSERAQSIDTRGMVSRHSLYHQGLLLVVRYLVAGSWINSDRI